MPVIGVPVTVPAPGVEGDERSAYPITQTIFGIALPAKMRSVVVRQKTDPILTFPLHSYNGDPVDLSLFTDSALYEVVLAVRESVACSCVVAMTTDGWISNPSIGEVQVPIPADALKRPGIYAAEITVREKADPKNARVVNTFWMLAEHSLFGDVNTGLGPPTLAEVRLHLRDAPEGNRLLDDYEFDPAEVALASRRCVEWYNEVEPPLPQRYDTNNFPYRYFWLEGIVAELFTTAAHWYRRNRFNYNAGGIQVSSLDKEPEYMAAMQYHRQRWEEFARKAKVRANMDSGFMTLGSSYSYDWRV